MIIVIKETGKKEDLTVKGFNGIEWTQDLLGNSGFKCWNNETEQNEMSQDDFNWWKEYIDNYEADEIAIAELAEELDIDVDEIYERISNSLTCDMDDEHSIKLNILEEIKEEYK